MQPKNTDVVKQIWVWRMLVNFLNVFAIYGLKVGETHQIPVSTHISTEQVDFRSKFHIFNMRRL